MHADSKKKNQRRSALICVPSLLLLTALFLASMAFVPLEGITLPAPVEAQKAALQDPTVRVEPVESVVDVGETFTIRVMIDEASELGGFEFALFFANATVMVDEVTLGDFLGSTGRTVITVGPTINNEAGVTRFGAVTIGSAAGPNGTGELAVISLTTQGLGTSPLDLEDVMVLNTSAEHASPIVEDGTVVAGGAPTATATPTATTTPTSTPTATPTSSVQRVYLPLVLKGW